MKITGILRLDLSMYVNRRVLFIGDTEFTAEMWGALTEHAGPVHVDIGDAGNVRWDPRLLDLLVGRQVAVIGTNSRGVAHAVDGLVAAIPRGAA